MGLISDTFAKSSVIFKLSQPLPPHAHWQDHRSLLEVSLLLFRTATKFSSPSGVIRLLPVLPLFTGTHEEHTTASIPIAALNSDRRIRCMANLRCDATAWWKTKTNPCFDQCRTQYIDDERIMMCFHIYIYAEKHRTTCYNIGVWHTATAVMKAIDPPSSPCYHIHSIKHLTNTVVAVKKPCIPQSYRVGDYWLTT